MLLGWNHLYKKSTVVIRNWLTVTKYPYVKWQWILSILRRVLFSFLCHRQDIYKTCLYEYYGWCLIRSRNRLPFMITWFHLQFFCGGSVLLIFLISCVVLCFCFVCLCLVCPMLPVSLNCPFLIAPSVFANVYFPWISFWDFGTVPTVSVVLLFVSYHPIWPYVK